VKKKKGMERGCWDLVLGLIGEKDDVDPGRGGGGGPCSPGKREGVHA